MSFSCAKHGWQHLLKSCPNCFEYSASNSTAQEEPEFTITPNVKSGAWLERKGGEGMQVKGEKLKELMKLIEEFWDEHF